MGTGQDSTGQRDSRTKIRAGIGGEGGARHVCVGGGEGGGVRVGGRLEVVALCPSPDPQPLPIASAQTPLHIPSGGGLFMAAFATLFCWPFGAEKSVTLYTSRFAPCHARRKTKGADMWLCGQQQCAQGCRGRSRKGSCTGNHAGKWCARIKAPVGCISNAV